MHLRLASLFAVLSLLIPVPARAQNSRWGAGYFPNVELTIRTAKSFTSTTI